MYKLKTLNKIAPAGLDVVKDDGIFIDNETETPDAPFSATYLRIISSVRLFPRAKQELPMQTEITVSFIKYLPLRPA